MTERFSQRPLSDLADLSGGFAFKSSDYKDTGRFILRTLNIRDDGTIDRSAAVFISEKMADEYSRFALQPHDTLFVMVGATLGKIGNVRASDLPALLNQNMWRIRAKANADARYIYYAFRDAVKTTLGWASGSARDFMRRDDFRHLHVFAPPLDEQRAVASVLGALDDKIELNRKMSATLEAMARTLFKSWFVDFDPVRAKNEGRDPGLPAEIVALFPDSFEITAHGQIPSGWLTKSVSDMATASRATINPGDFPDEYFEHHSIPAFDGGRVAILERGESIKSNKFIVLQDAVLLSRLNPRTPRIWMPTSIGPHRSICSTEFAVMFPKAQSSREWLYCLFSNQTFCDRFTTMVTGTSGSHQRVRPESLLTMPIVVPAEQVVRTFTKIARPFLKGVAITRNESLTLASLRDALLPKLISGELRVRDAERILAASA